MNIFLQKNRIEKRIKSMLYNYNLSHIFQTQNQRSFINILAVAIALKARRQPNVVCQNAGNDERHCRARLTTHIRRCRRDTALSLSLFLSSQKLPS